MHVHRQVLLSYSLPLAHELCVGDCLKWLSSSILNASLVVTKQTLPLTWPLILMWSFFPKKISQTNILVLKIA